MGYEQRIVSKLGSLPSAVARGVSEFWVELTWRAVLPEAICGVELGHGVVNVLFATIVIVAGLWLWPRRMLWGIWVAMLLAQSLMHKPIERYVLPFLPLLLLGYWRAVGALRNRAWPWMQGWLVGALAVLVLAPNLGLCVVFVLEQRSADRVEVQDGGKFAMVPAMADAVRAHVPEDGWLVCERRRMLELLTRRRVVSPGDAAAIRDGDLAAVNVVWKISTAGGREALAAWRDAGWRVCVEASSESEAAGEPWRLLRLDREAEP